MKRELLVLVVGTGLLALSCWYSFVRPYQLPPKEQWYSVSPPRSDLECWQHVGAYQSPVCVERK